MPENVQVFYKYKGLTVADRHELVSFMMASNQSVLEPRHNDRETMYTNVSLMFLNTIQKDMGSFAL